MEIINMSQKVGFEIKIKAKFNNDTVEHYHIVIAYDIDEFEDYIEDMDNNDWIEDILEDLTPITPIGYVATVYIMGFDHTFTVRGQ